MVILLLSIALIIGGAALIYQYYKTPPEIAETAVTAELTSQPPEAVRI